MKLLNINRFQGFGDQICRDLIDLLCDILCVTFCARHFLCEPGQLAI